MTEKGQIMTEGTARDWRKAKRSISNGACVKVAAAAGAVFVGDTKDDAAPVLAYTAQAWRTFGQAVRNGDVPGSREELG